MSNQIPPIDIDIQKRIDNLLAKILNTIQSYENQTDDESHFLEQRDLIEYLIINILGILFYAR